MRTQWPERTERTGWITNYTAIGGRSKLDPLQHLSPELEAVARRSTSQVLVATSVAQRTDDPAIRYWATVCRKLLQRGTNPVLHHQASSILDATSTVPAELLSAVVGLSTPFDLDESMTLHPGIEQPFWELLRQADHRLLRWLTPQAPLPSLLGEDIDVGESWVDFLAYFPWNPSAVVIELDGEAFHRSAPSDRQRDVLLEDVGIASVRFSRDEALGMVSNERRDALLSAIPDWIVEPDTNLVRSIHAPAAAHRLAYGIVEAVELGVLKPGEDWRIELEDVAQLTVALEPAALDLLVAIDDVWDLKIVPRRVAINETVWLRTSNGRFEATEGSDSTRATALIRLEPFVPPHAELGRADVPTIVIRGALLPVDLPWGSQSSTERRNRAKPTEADAGLDNLVRDLYGFPSYQEGQKSAISRILSGGDACVLLPTGAGKSLIYQVSGLLRPGVTLIVAPLRSLIDDQQRRLEDEGIDRVAGLHSGRGSSRQEKLKIQQAIADGESLFVLVAPERLQIEDFRTHLRDAAALQLINLAVVDEAHCVSEWGHQFRTSYLKLGRNLRRFGSGDDDVPPPILALTATASPRVLNDLLTELGLDRDEPGVLHRPSTFDRPNLHYRIARGDLSQREGNVERALSLIADDLGVEIRKLAIANGSETLSGIVFVPHASSGLHLGLKTYRDLVARTTGIPDTAIALFAGTKPNDLTFGTSWDKEKERFTHEFRTNQRPVMVCTNAFGMGIDKPNIRYTIHVTQPSSIEAYAQEAGRSGRDGHDSYCYLVSANTSGINEATIDSKEDVNLSYAKDDLLILLSQLMSSFPGRDREIKVAHGVLLELLENDSVGLTVGLLHNPSGVHNPPDGRADEDEKRDRERALFRLMLLGVVDDYTIDYSGVGTYKVYLNALDPTAIRTQAGELIHRLSAGNRRFTEIIDSIPKDADLRDVVLGGIDALVTTLYGTVEPGRLNALREMYLLTRLDDSEAIREKINAYLSEGPVALILDKNVRREATLVDTLRELDSTGHANADEWAGAATRYLDAYADHPVLLAVRALGEAWRSGGSRAQFVAVVQRLADSLPEFGFRDDDQSQLLRWVLDQLRQYLDGERWDWAPDIWGALADSAIPETVLDGLEAQVFDMAANGRFNSSELGAVFANRLSRTTASTKIVVDELARVG